MAVKNTDIFGRKVFFISPDTSLILPAFMEDFCALGYETHILGRGDGSLSGNIAFIVGDFPDAAIFINTDSDAPGMSWLSFIRQLRQQSPDLIIGAVFSSHGGDTKAHNVAADYGNDLSPQAGCIALSPGDSDGNFKALVAAFEKIGVKGRRNNIRAQCGESSYVSFTFGTQSFHARIDDVNISHVACILSGPAIGSMRIYDKVRGARVCVEGLEFATDIVLIMKRVKGGMSNAVFMFIRKPDDEPGLPQEQEASLNKKIYQITSKKFRDSFREIAK